MVLFPLAPKYHLPAPPCSDVCRSPSHRERAAATSSCLDMAQWECSTSLRRPPRRHCRSTKTLLCSGCSRDPRRNKARPGVGWAAGPGQGEAVPTAMGRGVPTGASAGAAPPASASSLPAGCCPGGLCKRQTHTDGGTRGSQGNGAVGGNNPAAASLQHLCGSRQGSSHSGQEQALAPGLLTLTAAPAWVPQAQGWLCGARGTQPRALLTMEQLWGFTPFLAEQLGLGCTWQALVWCSSQPRLDSLAEGWGSRNPRAMSDAGGYSQLLSPRVSFPRLWGDEGERVAGEIPAEKPLAASPPAQALPLPQGCGVAAALAWSRPLGAAHQPPTRSVSLEPLSGCPGAAPGAAGHSQHREGPLAGGRGHAGQSSAAAVQPAPAAAAGPWAGLQGPGQAGGQAQQQQHQQQRCHSDAEPDRAR